MPAVRHPRGTRAALVALAGSAGLVPHQIYVLTDEERIAIALTASTFKTFAKQGEAAAYFGPTAPDPAEFTDWFLPTGEWFKWDGAAWFQPVGAKGDPGDPGAPAAISKVAATVVPGQFGPVSVTLAAAGALPANTVLCQLVPNVEWDADDLTGLSVVGVAGTDNITFTIDGPGLIVGALAIAYQIG